MLSSWRIERTGEDELKRVETEHRAGPQVIYSIAVSFREAAVAKGGDAADVYGRVAWLIIITWICYP